VIKGALVIPTTGLILIRSLVVGWTPDTELVELDSLVSLFPQPAKTTMAVPIITAMQYFRVFIIHHLHVACRLVEGAISPAKPNIYRQPGSQKILQAANCILRRANCIFCRVDWMAPLVYADNFASLEMPATGYFTTGINQRFAGMAPATEGAGLKCARMGFDHFSRPVNSMTRVMDWQVV
jgi:hypothetical protein